MQELINWVRELAQGDGLQALIIAVILLAVTAVVARACTALIRRILRSDGSPLPASSILVNIVRVCVWLLGLSLVLSACFDVNVNGLIAALGVGGIAVSLGLQDTIQNFFGGLQVTLMKIIKPGDHVLIGTTEGIVEDVAWRQTIVRDFEGAVHIIPNSILNSKEITKYDPACLVSTPINFSYTGQDINDQVEAMERAAKEAIEKVATLKVDPWILISGMGYLYASARLRFVLEDTAPVREARDAALAAMLPFTTNEMSRPKEEVNASDKEEGGAEDAGHKGAKA